MNTYNPNKIYINKNNIIHNLNEMSNIVNLNNYGNKVEIMPVIKANAYGLGVENILSIINEMDIKIVGVANVEEAIKVRQFFYGKILVLSPVFNEQIPELLKYNITPTISEYAFAKELNDMTSKTINVHIKIDTGLNRTGFKPDNLKELIDIIDNLENINIEGIYTHFTARASDLDFLNYQMNTFDNVLNELKEKYPNLNIKYTHVLNTAGILNCPTFKYNLARSGILMYGYSNTDESKRENFNFKPAVEFKTRIAHIHYVKENETIGYNRIFKAERDMKAAILPLGYADAFVGLKSNVAHVLINNIKAKVVAVCMDTLIVDITDIDNVEKGTEVVIWDNINITIEDWAEWTNSYKYSILTGLSDRIDKILI